MRIIIARLILRCNRPTSPSIAGGGKSVEACLTLAGEVRYVALVCAHCASTAPWYKAQKQSTEAPTTGERVRLSRNDFRTSSPAVPVPSCALLFLSHFSLLSPWRPSLDTVPMEGTVYHQGQYPLLLSIEYVCCGPWDIRTHTDVDHTRTLLNTLRGGLLSSCRGTAAFGGLSNVIDCCSRIRE